MYINYVIHNVFTIVLASLYTFSNYGLHFILIKTWLAKSGAQYHRDCALAPIHVTHISGCCEQCHAS